MSTLVVVFVEGRALEVTAKGHVKTPQYRLHSTFSANVKRQTLAVRTLTRRVMKQKILEHLDDIDFRTKAERQKQIIPDLTHWYETLVTSPSLMTDERLQGQLTMLSSVLWHLLPEKDYKQLTKFKNSTDKALKNE